MQEVTGSSPVPSTKTKVSNFGWRLFCCVCHCLTSEQDGTGLEQHGHAAGVANNSPVGCCLVRGFQRLGMSTKKAPPAGAPFAEPRFMQYRTGTMYVRAIRKKQRQGITMVAVSCLLLYGAFQGNRCVRRKKGKFWHIGVFFRFAVWYNRLNKSEFIKENIDETIFMFALFKCRKSDKGRN